MSNELERRFKEVYFLLNQCKYEEANRILLPLTKTSNPQALFLYAQNLYNGNGVKRNRPEAYKLFDKVLDICADVKSIEKYVNMRFEDFDIFSSSVSEKEKDENMKRTFSLYDFAAMYESTHPFVYYNFGTCYESGYGTMIDYEESIKNYEKALNLIKKGFGNTKKRLHFHLGRLKLRNEKTFNSAVKHIQLAVESGYSPSFVYLGRLLYEGKIVKKDDSTAFNLFSLAAKKGVIEGQFYLAEMYEKGIEKVVEKNLNKAIDLYFAVAVALSGRNNVTIESLPKIASLPENWDPIDQRAIEKLRNYRPQLINLLDKYKFKKENECTSNAIEESLQHCFICYDRPDTILDRCICSYCMKNCYEGCFLIDYGIAHHRCGCLISLKK